MIKRIMRTRQEAYFFRPAVPPMLLVVRRKDDILPGYIYLVPGPHLPRDSTLFPYLNQFFAQFRQFPAQRMRA